MRSQSDGHQQLARLLGLSHGAEAVAALDRFANKLTPEELGVLSRLYALGNVTIPQEIREAAHKKSVSVMVIRRARDRAISQLKNSLAQERREKEEQISPMPLLYRAACDEEFLESRCESILAHTTKFPEALSQLHAEDAEKTERVLFRLAFEGNWQTGVNVGQSPFATAKVLSILSGHDDSTVRRVAVMNKRCPRERVVMALTDSDEDVCEAAVQRLRNLISEEAEAT